MERTNADHDELTALGTIVGSLKRVRPGEPSADAHAAVDELFPQGHERTEYVWRFSALIILSSSIAAFGLLADSAAVVIGAMLVAPLMTPILATSAATVRALNRELAIALLIVALGTVLAIAVGYVVSFIAGDTIVGPTELPGEVSSRTFPGLLDLGIAVTAGAAAGYILPRRSATSALPGVGIAVALVPPLSVVGITLETGANGDAWGALLLFLTNLAAIVFSASAMLLLAGFTPDAGKSRKGHTTRILVTLGAVIAVAVPLTAHTRSTLEDGRLRRTVATSVESWDSSASIIDLTANVGADGTADVEVLIAGPNQPARVWELARSIQDGFDGPVELQLLYAQDLRFQVSVR